MRPRDLPDKFWDAAAGAIRADELVKSYNELERRFTGGGDRVPDSADGYRIEAPNEYLAPDPGFNARLHEAGFTQRQAQFIYDLGAEVLTPMVLELTAKIDSQRQVGNLEREYGGADRWRETSRQIAAWAKANLPAQVYENMARSEEGVRALHRMMSGQAEPTLAGGGAPVGGGDGEQTLRQLMRDPAYWRDGDPKVVARVREGFRRLYPD
ncbi:MAG: hypothetical protein H6907_11460 [Hyphomicrobiales bacterium]|nr:hypothetical protein [Hyphomicrobiales bacterium]MCP5372339.1 hypothetical protein [Hyphomicrobiales bacterium]